MGWWQGMVMEIIALLGVGLMAVSIPWVLATKREAASAAAWCLVILFLPYLGSFLFLIFGYQHVNRPLKRKQRHKKWYRQSKPIQSQVAYPDQALPPPFPDSSWGQLSRLAQRMDAFPVTQGNRVQLFHEGQPAYQAMLEAIEAARHHVHLLTFILQPDAQGQRFLEALTKKARQGIQVRLLFDAMGSYRLHRHRELLRPLQAAGGEALSFLPVNPLRRRLQVNLRNHRKILVVDGRVAFTGGLNVGQEYLGVNPRFGFWRDTHLRLEGPAVSGLQYVFLEDWDFAAGQQHQGAEFYPQPASPGDVPVQIIHSGPDQGRKSIREIYFAAILSARRRLWLATPYFVPDTGILDALRLAGFRGVDVRLLCQYHPDKWIPFFAGRYYWEDMLAAGVRIYQYTRGMMHSKLVMVDDEWASVGTANLDNRSLHLNFEVDCLFYSPSVVEELERAFLQDLSDSIQLRQKVFCRRPFAGRLVENACRLLSPVL